MTAVVHCSIYRLTSFPPLLFFLTSSTMKFSTVSPLLLSAASLVSSQDSKSKDLLFLHPDSLQQPLKPAELMSSYHKTTIIANIDATQPCQHPPNLPSHCSRAFKPSTPSGLSTFSTSSHGAPILTSPFSTTHSLQSAPRRTHHLTTAPLRHSNNSSSQLTRSTPRQVISRS